MSPKLIKFCEDVVTIFIGLLVFILLVGIIFAISSFLLKSEIAACVVTIAIIVWLYYLITRNE